MQVYADVKQNFIDKVKMYDYLFDYTVNTIDKVSAVQDKIKQLSEDDLINRVLLPLLTRMKFQKVERTPYHGQKEKGLDIRPFYDIDKFGRRIYYGAQVKAIDIHTDSRKEGHAASINNQIQIALNSDFLDYEDNENKRIDKILIITSGKINERTLSYIKSKQNVRSNRRKSTFQFSSEIRTSGSDIAHQKKQKEEIKS